MNDADILVSGGGIAGMVASLAMAKAGFRTLCVDPTRAEGMNAGREDKRTTAFLQPARALLEDIGVWSAIADQATPLQVMAIADLGDDGAIRAYRGFDASEISEDPFGWNVPNTAIRAALVGAIEAADLLTFRRGTSAQTMLARDTEARVRFSDGTKGRYRLVIGADGRGSAMREAAGIDADIWRYGQKALVFSVTHSKPHQNTSIEVHRTGGPFTVVPLSDPHQSSVVWMETGANALALSQLEEADFLNATQERSGSVLGEFTAASKPQVWPIIAQRAQSITGQRLALIAEAAHVLPPIGAQGLNLSLGDIRTLRDLAKADASGLGGAKMLGAYSRARTPVMSQRVRGIDALNRASMSGSPLARDLRGEALKLLHDLKPVRTGLMRAGLG